MIALALAVPFLFLHIKYQPGVRVPLGSTHLGLEMSDLAVVLALPGVGPQAWGPYRPTAAGAARQRLRHLGTSVICERSSLDPVESTPRVGQMSGLPGAADDTEWATDDRQGRPGAEAAGATGTPLVTVSGPRRYRTPRPISELGLARIPRSFRCVER